MQKWGGPVPKREWRNVFWRECTLGLIKLWRKRKSVVFTWLLSYCAVFFVPILMSLIIYRESNEALRSEIHRANDTMLQQVRDTIDSQLDHMQRLNVELTWNPKLQDLFYSNLTDSDAQYTAYQVVKEYKVYQTSFTSIDEFYVTWEKEEKVLRPSNIRDYITAFDTIHNTGTMNQQKWLDTIRGTKPKSFAVLPRLDGTTAKKSLAYFTHLPAGIDGKPTGTVVVMADTERFSKAIEKIQSFSGGQVYILDEDNQVLISNSPKAPSDLIMRQITNNESGVLYDKEQSGASEIFYIRSGVSKLKYVSVIPSGLYWEKAEYVRRFTYISVLISTGGAGVLTFFFLLRNYSPIRRLVRALSTGEGQERTEINELNFIHSAVSNTLNEKENIKLQLQRQNNMLRSNMLARLLKGKLDSPIPLTEGFDTFQIRLKSDDFAVILFFFEDNEAIYSGFPSMELYEKRRLVQFILTNVVEELTGQKNHFGYVAEVDDMLACIVNFDQECTDQRSEDLLWISSEAQQFLMQSYRMELTLSISGIHNTLAGVSQAYQEALDAMEYKMVLGKREIISYHQIQRDTLTETQLGYYYPLIVEQQLINFIKIGDFEKASVVLKDITERNFEKPLVSLTLARCLMFNLISTMIKTINELGGVEDSFLANNPQWMDKIVACDTIKEMHEELMLLLYQVCKYAAAKLESNISKERTESLRELAAEVAQYIHNRYNDMNLNVNMIGEHFRMKPSYLSKLFKDQTGEGLLDYINKYRIERAKELIHDRQTAIFDVGKKVGFGEAATFIRVFKKYEGITPGKYREME
jgi:two-component system response regulator YesN